MRFAILNDDINDLIRDVTTFGSLFFYCLLALVFLILKENNLFLELLISLALCYLISVPIRLLFFKKRPKEQRYNNFLEKITAGSFPSLHSMRSILLVIFLSQFFQNILLTIVLIILFVLVTITRILLKKHYFIDIFGGTLIGILIWYLTNIITQSL